MASQPKRPKLCEPSELFSKDNEIADLDSNEMQSVDDSSEMVDFSTDSSVKKTKYNFGKRKCRYSDKRTKDKTRWEKEYLSTPEGRKKRNESARLSMENYLSTSKRKKLKFNVV